MILTAEDESGLRVGERYLRNDQSECLEEVDMREEDGIVADVVRVASEE